MYLYYIVYKNERPTSKNMADMDEKRNKGQYNIPTPLQPLTKKMLRKLATALSNI